MLEKTLESTLDCKEIQPDHPKGDQSWVFIGRTHAKAETPILWPPHVKSGVSCGVTVPFSWVLVHTRYFCVCVPQELVSLVLYKFCNQIPLAFKVKFPGDSQSFFWIPKLGNLLWALELLQLYENLFGISVLQFVHHLNNSVLLPPNTFFSFLFYISL